MHPKSKFLYTSPTSRRTPRIPRPERGAQDPGCRCSGSSSQGFPRTSGHRTGAGVVLDLPLTPATAPWSASARQFRPMSGGSHKYNFCNTNTAMTLTRAAKNSPPESRSTPEPGSFTFEIPLMAFRVAVPIPLVLQLQICGEEFQAAPVMTAPGRCLVPPSPPGPPQH